MPRIRTSAQPAAGGDADANPDPSFHMPPMAFNVLKSYQTLFIMMAQAEVRQRGNQGALSAVDQQVAFLDAYKRIVTLWFRDDAQISRIPNMPPCPQALRNLGSEASVVRAMLATTSTGNRSHTGESLRNKAKDIKKEMLCLIALWNVCCKVSAQSAVIARPGTGEGVDLIYSYLVAAKYRVAETQRVMKLRLAWYGIDSEQRDFCTLERIKEAYTSHFYATRGFSQIEQHADTALFLRNGRSAQSSIHRQITELVAAEFELNGEPVLQEQAPCDQQLRQSFQEVICTLRPFFFCLFGTPFHFALYIIYFS
jgi:hypothetical protein